MVTGKGSWPANAFSSNTWAPTTADVGGDDEGTFYAGFSDSDAEEADEDEDDEDDGDEGDTADDQLERGYADELERSCVDDAVPTPRLREAHDVRTPTM
jgi:hypothetical protein